MGHEFLILRNKGRSALGDHAERADHELRPVFGQRVEQRARRVVRLDAHRLLQKHGAGVEPASIFMMVTPEMASPFMTAR